MEGTRRVGLIGDPVEHSLSPAFQQPAFDALGMAIRYELWPTPLAELPARLDDLRAGRAIGANVTVPHKEAVFAAMDDVSDLAQRVGAVNTIIPRGDRLYGDNTDAYGFIVPLRDRGVEFSRLDAVVLGAGGAARGVVVALLDAGVQRVHVLNRTVERARRMVAEIDDPRLMSGSTGDDSGITGAGLIVNATSLGWHDDALPIDREAFDRLARDAIAYDLTYRETAFLRAARAAGLAAIDGLPMLVHQGARSFELWTGRPGPVDVMWSAAVQARAARSA